MNDLAKVAMAAAQRAAVEWLRVHNQKADADALAECLAAMVKIRMPAALHDARQALECNMGKVAERTFLASMALAGIEAAKEAGYTDDTGVVYEIPAAAIEAAAAAQQ